MPRYTVDLSPPFLVTTVEARDEDHAVELALVEFEERLWDGTFCVDLEEEV